MINYNCKTFRQIENSTNGEVSAETIFHYKQSGNVVTASYSGGKIKAGQLIALADEMGNLNMRYQHVNDKNELMTGTCMSIPEILPNQKIRIYEHWQWTCGDLCKGESLLEEV